MNSLLSADSPKSPLLDQPYGSVNEDKKEAIFEELNQELRKRINILEEFCSTTEYRPSSEMGNY